MTKLKQFRELKGMTQKELAEAAGISIRLLQEYEQGRKDLWKAATRTTMNLADALWALPSEILPDEE